MSLRHLPTLAEMHARPRAMPKSATPSRLQRKVAQEKDDSAKLKIWRDEVFARDERICRCCKVRVIRLAVQTLHPRRAEAHHVAGRDDATVRTDTRNGLTLCAQCHQLVTGIVGGRLVIVGTVWFIKGGQRFINCDYPVLFQKVKA